MDNVCATHQAVLDRITRLEKEVYGLMESRNRSDVWQAETDVKLDNIVEKLNKLDITVVESIKSLQDDIKVLSEKPSKRLETIITVAISTVVSAGVTMAITQFLK